MNSKQPPDEGLKESRRARDSFFVRNQDETIIWQAGSSGMIFGTE